MKAWLLRWLDVIPRADFVRALSIIQTLDKEFQSYKLESDAAVSELIAELNLLRNSIPAAATQATTRPVRVFRNFREFRTEAERRPGNPIKIERTS